MPAAFEDLKRLIEQNTNEISSDNNYPLNQLAAKNMGVSGPKLSRQEFADLQHDLANAAKNASSIPEMLKNENVPDNVKQAAIQQQRKLIAEIQHNKMPNNGVRPNGRQLNHDEQQILNLAQRNGFTIPGSAPAKHKSNPLANALAQPSAIETVGASIINGISKNQQQKQKPSVAPQASVDLSTPPPQSDDDIEIVSI